MGQSPKRKKLQRDNLYRLKTTTSIRFDAFEKLLSFKTIKQMITKLINNRFRIALKLVESTGMISLWQSMRHAMSIFVRDSPDMFEGFVKVKPKVSFGNQRRPRPKI